MGRHDVNLRFLLDELAKTQSGEESKYLQYLLPIMTEKLERYFLSVGTLSQKKQDPLFIFEEPNLQHFYQRLREFYRSQGWEQSPIPSHGISNSLKTKTHAHANPSEIKSSTPQTNPPQLAERTTPLSRDSVGEAPVCLPRESASPFTLQQEPSHHTRATKDQRPSSAAASQLPNAAPNRHQDQSNPQVGEFNHHRDQLAKLIPKMEKKMSTGSSSTSNLNPHTEPKQPPSKPAHPQDKNPTKTRKLSIGSSLAGSKHSRHESGRSDEPSDTQTTNRLANTTKTRDSSASSRESRLTDRSLQKKPKKTEAKETAKNGNEGPAVAQAVDEPAKKAAAATKKYISEQFEIKEENEVDASMVLDPGHQLGEDLNAESAPGSAQLAENRPIVTDSPLLETITQQAMIDSPLPDQELHSRTPNNDIQTECPQEVLNQLQNSDEKKPKVPAPKALNTLNKVNSRRKNSGNAQPPEVSKGPAKTGSTASKREPVDARETPGHNPQGPTNNTKLRTTSILSRKKAPSISRREAVPTENGEAARQESTETEKHKGERKVVRFDKTEVVALPSIQSESSETEGKDGKKSQKSVGRSSTGRSSIGTPKSNVAAESSKRPTSKISSSSSSVASKNPKRPTSARSGVVGFGSSQPSTSSRPRSGRRNDQMTSSGRLSELQAVEPAATDAYPTQDRAKHEEPEIEGQEFSDTDSSQEADAEQKDHAESNRDASHYDSDDSDNQQRSSQCSDFEDIKSSNLGFARDTVQERSAEESNDSGMKDIDKIDEVESLEDILPEFTPARRLSHQEGMLDEQSEESQRMSEDQKGMFLEDSQPEQISIVGREAGQIPYVELDIDFGNFDQENDGEFKDPMEYKILSEDSSVPVISGNLAEAVLAPIDEPLSFSTSSYNQSQVENQRSQVENQSQETYGGKEHPSKTSNGQFGDVHSWRQSLGMIAPQVLKRSEMNSMGNSGVQAVNNSTIANSNNQREIAQNPQNSSQISLANSSIAQSKNSKSQAKADNEQAGSVSLKGEEHSVAPASHVAPPNLKKQPSHQTGSQPQKKHSLSTTGINSSMMSRNDHSITGGPHPKSSILNQSVLNSTSNTVMSEKPNQLVVAKKMNYEQFHKKTNNCASKYLVLYVSLLILQSRFKEANKEVNALFNISLVNEDMWLLLHMTKLKVLLLLHAKKFEEAGKFNELLTTLAKLGKFELYSVISMFTNGYLKFMQGDTMKSKLSFTAAMRGYRYMDHLVGEYYCCIHLKNIFSKEKREQEAKEIKEKLKKLKNVQNLKNCINGRKHKFGTFLIRIRGEMCSILIELEVRKQTKDEDEIFPKGFKFKNGMRIAQNLYDDFCK